jgi:hypothetical protein
LLKKISPDGGDPRIEKYDHEDWGKQSNGRFNQAHPEGRVAIGYSHVDEYNQLGNRNIGHSGNSGNHLNI